MAQSREKVVYSVSDYKRDQENFSLAEKGKRPFDLSGFKRLMVHDLVTNTDILRTYKIGNYPVEKIREALERPMNHPNMLIDVSNYLMGVSTFYMRLCQYFGKMGLFNYNIDIYDVREDKLESEEQITALRNALAGVCGEFEKMGFRHEMMKIMSILPVEDVFYGLIFEDTTDFFILKIRPSICQICQMQDGVFNFRINLSGINPLKISGYPDYLQRAYLDYKDGKDYRDGWYIPPADKQVCLKLNESTLYPVPMMLAVAGDIMDLDIYKQLKLQKARVDNYKAIVIEIPIDKDAVDKPLLTDETLSFFAELNKANMPDDLGLIHAPGSAEAVSFKDNANTTNNLSDAIKNLYDNAGVPSQVFNSTASSTALKLAIENDAAIIYAFYRQVERYFTRFIKLRKYNKPNYKFAIRIHDSTVFNRYDVADAMLKASQNGLPFKIDYGVALGKSPSRQLGALFVENNVLKLHEKYIPLATSYTSNGNDIGGRPTNESQGKDLSDAGEKTSDSEANSNR